MLRRSEDRKDFSGSVIGGFPVNNNHTTGLLLVHADGDVCIDLAANKRH